MDRYYKQQKRIICDSFKLFNVILPRDWDVYFGLAVPGMFLLCIEWWLYEVGTIFAGLKGATTLGGHSVCYQVRGFYNFKVRGL